MPFRIALLLLALWTCGLAQDAAALAEKLPKCAAVVLDGSQLFLQAPNATRFVVRSVTAEGAAVVEAKQRAVNVDADLLHADASAALNMLEQLVTQATKDGVDGALRLRSVPLVGPHLSSGTAWVLPEGVAKKQPGSSPATRLALADAVKPLESRVKSLEVTPAGQQAVSQLLAMLTEDETTDSFLKPPFARALVRGGWLRTLPQLDAEARRLETALAAAEALRPKLMWVGKGIRVAELTNAFGASGWTLQTPLRSGYARVLPKPGFDPACPELSLVVSLPAGSDPLKDAAKATNAEVLFDGMVLARWSAAGLVADSDTWRKTVAQHSLRTPGIAKGFLPPHIPLFDLDGTLHKLITAHGVLDMAEAKNSAAFLNAAAKVLPDVGHMDLLGECMFTYVLDSPDPRFPLLVGTDKVQGEIHQTVAQTLATTSGGICRGDCDDIAELYQEVALRQGKLAHIANLPGHAACFWVDKLEDGGFVAHVLQTGPPMSFAAKTVPEALRAAYTEFGIADNFDPDQIAVAIRFNGENQRSTWVLGWRIFTEKDYATAMIDVQRDWHFHTFRRGIVKMEAMVAGGDKDPANERELVGLCEATAQWSAAVEHVKRAQAAGDPTFTLATRLIADLFESGQRDAAQAAVEALLTTDLPAAAKSLGLGMTSVGFQLAGTVLASGRDPALAARCLDSTCTAQVQRLITQLGGFIRSNRFNAEAWKHDGTMVELRRLIRTYVSLGCGILEDAPSLLADANPAATRISQQVEQWLATIAFRDFDEPAELLDRYADAGRYAAIALGNERFHSMLQRGEWPTQLPTEPWTRSAGVAQLTQDAAFVRMAPSWYGQQLLNQFGTGRKTYDAALVQRLWKGMESARTAARKLGLESRVMDQLMASCRVMANAALKDKAGLKAALIAVAQQNDKHLRDQVVAWMGQSARFFDTVWFGEMLTVFDAEIHYKPSYFEIAWKAAQGGAIPHALLAADLAEKRFGDDPTFREEAAWLRALLGPKKP
ncbi:MAG: hypothetical protein EXS14_02265 [Planctomycetes bacterium]|nr:hypothetical protein [Planctomycetota bacterium]